MLLGIHVFNVFCSSRSYFMWGLSQLLWFKVSFSFVHFNGFFFNIFILKIFLMLFLCIHLLFLWIVFSLSYVRLEKVLSHCCFSIFCLDSSWGKEIGLEYIMVKWEISFYIVLMCSTNNLNFVWMPYKIITCFWLTWFQQCMPGPLQDIELNIFLNWCCKEFPLLVLNVFRIK